MWKNILLVLVVLFVLYTFSSPCKSKQKHVSFAPEYEIYGTMTCGYTVKMINHMKEVGKTYKFIDVSKEPHMYKYVLDQYKQKHVGVPFVVHIPTNTFFVGFKPLK